MGTPGSEERRNRGIAIGTPVQGVVFLILVQGVYLCFSLSDVSTHLSHTPLQLAKMRNVYALCLGVCLLAGRASAFVLSPSARGAVSLGRATTAAAPYVASARRGERTSGLVMQSSLESSVSLYKKAVGNQRWETDEGIEKRAAGTFAEMCKVYGEENATKMVRKEEG